MRSLIPTLGAFGIAMCLLPIRIAADEVLTTPVNVVRFAGAEDKNCPTGVGMFTLLGSRAILTVPQIPAAAKDAAVQADIDADFLHDTVLRVSGLPDRSGTRFEFINTTCDVEITIRYNSGTRVDRRAQ
jgi:hypothetical protein